MDDTLVRILNLMKEKHVTAVAMEDFIAVPHCLFSNWKCGKEKSYYGHINRIATRLDESVDYLIRGSEYEALVGQERELISDFRRLSEEAKEVVIKTSDCW